MTQRKIAKYIGGIMKNDRSIAQQHLRKINSVEKYGFEKVTEEEFLSTIEFIRSYCLPKSLERIDLIIAEYTNQAQYD